MRPDLSYGAVCLQKKVNSATVEEILYANKLVEKVKAQKNKIHFVNVGDINKLVIYGLGDASYTAGKENNSAIGGQFIVLGTMTKSK